MPPSAAADSPEHVMPGSLWPRETVKGQLPPLVPATLPEDDSGWDANLLGSFYQGRVREPERRHSGWAAVEKKWEQRQVQEAKQTDERPLSKESAEIMSQLHPGLSLPPPRLEADFRMKVVLSSNVATLAVGDGFKKLTTFTEGVWSGNVGTGSVVDGGQDSVDMSFGNSYGTQVEAKFKLKTNDEPPAIIECKARGVRTGSEAVMNALEHEEQALAIDPRQYRHRMVINMRTNDPRYADKVNFEIWVGTCLWRGSELIYDAYKIR
ncbi:hypothetical protein PFICI_02421 [Pestalotiopsis fici W106-1]|uniref:Uncharacterized protein n=1 Tax=Pestalotiopsis fici (strain W106-1 / CGMCC3.15140) TaxID=1229662 RepID=W3XGQ5_PESFW|nr:uncharacterized protein PFICI_02421 [Pestalotiopsis fici W106-1]ETS84396.1 hypothetical protein PFICI_02421 [Pestalotiopsis fici W106-1]